MSRARRLDPDEMQGAVVLEPSQDQRIDEDVSDDAEAFDQFRESGDSEQAGKVIWVYRVPTDAKNNPTGEDSRHLFSAPIDRYDLPQLYDRIKKEYMPRGYGVGTFRISVRTVGQRGVHWKKLLILEKGAHDDEPLPPVPEIKTGDPAVAALAEAMRQQNELLARMFERRENPAPPVDPLAQTERMLAMVASLTTAMNGRPVAPTAAPQSISEMAAGFREMMRISREFGGEGGGGDDAEPAEGLAGILQNVAPVAGLLTKLLERIPVQAAPAPVAVQRRQLRQEPARAPGLSPEAIAAQRTAAQPQPPGMATAPQTQPQGDKAMLMKVVEVTNDLLAIKALHDEQQIAPDFAAIAESAVALIPANVEDKLLDLLESDNWFAKLSAFNPKLKQGDNPQFFTGLRDAILAQYTRDPEPGEGGEGGDEAGNPPGSDA